MKRRRRHRGADRARQPRRCERAHAQHPNARNAEADAGRDEVGRPQRPRTIRQHHPHHRQHRAERGAEQQQRWHAGGGEPKRVVVCARRVHARRERRVRLATRKAAAGRPLVGGRDRGEEGHLEAPQRR